MIDIKAAKRFLKYIGTVAVTGAVSALLASLQAYLSTHGVSCGEPADPSLALALGTAGSAVLHRSILVV